MKKKLLVIDDDREIIRALLIRLKKLNIEIHTALDGAAGLATARASRPDLVVLDIRMPGMDGYEVLQAMQAEPDLSAIPIIVLSANVAEPARRKALDLGAHQFLEKPIDAARLKDSICRLLGIEAAPGRFLSSLS